jgi:hypothetical protein
MARSPDSGVGPARPSHTATASEERTNEDRLSGLFGLSGLSRSSGLSGLFRLFGLSCLSGLSRLFGQFGLSSKIFDAAGNDSAGFSCLRID